MSIAPPPVVSTSTGSGTAKSSSDELIDARIVEACQALWWAELVRAGLRLVITGLAAVLVWVIVDQWIYSPGPALRTGVFAILLLSLGWYLWRQVVPLLGSSIRPEYAARSLERDMPELRQSLTSYVTLRNQRDIEGLRSRVVRSIGAATAGRLRVHDELPAEATGTLRWWIATAVMLALLVAYGAASPKNALQSAARLAAPFASIEPARRVSIREVRPGDTDAIAGRPLSVSALIKGMRDDEEAICSWDLPSGHHQVVLEKASGNNRFGGQLRLPHSASGEVEYWVSAGDASAGPFRLHVQDVPVVAVESVNYQPPAYTGQTAHTSSSGAITALDLTRVTIRASTNRPVARGVIEFNPRAHGEVVQATAGVKEMEIASDGRSLTISFPLRSARGRSAAVELESYRIKVWDAAKQSNPDPIVYPIRIVADLPPDVAIMLPIKSPSPVPINAQQAIEVHASDPDFGLKQIGLEIRSGIDLVATPIVWSDAKGAKGNHVTEYRFRPAEHGLRIGDTVEIVAVATDNRSIENDPSVEANVTRTDPIELKITPSEPLPSQADPDAEGLSAPDDRPASDDPSESQEASNEQSNQGQSGQAGQGEQQSGKGQSGQGQSGQGQSGQGQSGQGQSGQGQSGQGQSGQGQSGQGQSGQDRSGQSADGTSSDNQAGNDARAGEGTKGGSPSSEGASGAQDSTQQAGSDSSGSPSPQQTPAGGETSNAGQGGEGTSEGASSQDSQQRGAGNDRTQGQGSSSTDSAAAQGEPAQPGAQQDSGDSGPPKHDGDAFERIRDYLEQLRKQQQNSGSQSAGEAASGGSSNNQPQQSSGGGESPNDASQSSRSSSGDNANQSSAQASDQEKRSDRGASGNNAADRAGGQQSDSADAGASKSNGGQESGDTAKGGGDSQQRGSGGENQSQGSAGQDQGDSSSQKSGAQGTQSADQTKRSETGQGDAGSKSGEGQGGESAAAEAGESDQSQKERGAGNNQSSAASGRNETGDSQASGNRSTPSDRATGGDASSQSPSGGGDGGDGSGLAGDSDSAVPPDPVNLEYAKRATDMVLDYLEETRDSPDKDLLEKLNWSEEDLKRFTDRWQKIRELPSAQQPAADANQQLTEALKSLGLRPPSEAADNAPDQASSIRNVRDAGNRKPPPAAYRDAFDAFRRAVGRQ